MRVKSITDLLRAGLFGNERGVTLSELVVAMVVLTIGVLGGMASFKYIAQGISSARTKTIVSNLGQEKKVLRCLEKTIKNIFIFILLCIEHIHQTYGYFDNYMKVK